MTHDRTHDHEHGDHEHVDRSSGGAPRDHATPRSLRSSLRALADVGIENAPPAEVLDHLVTTRVRQSRRRRPALVAGTAVAALALTGTGAYAAFWRPPHTAPSVAVADLARPDGRDVDVRALCGLEAPQYLRMSTGDVQLTQRLVPGAASRLADDASGAVGATVVAGDEGDVLVSFTQDFPELALLLRGSAPADVATVGPAGFFVVKDGVVVGTPPAPSPAGQDQQDPPADEIETVAPGTTAPLTSPDVEPCETDFTPGTYTVYGAVNVRSTGSPHTSLAVGPGTQMVLTEAEQGGWVRYFGTTAPGDSMIRKHSKEEALAWDWPAAVEVTDDSLRSGGAGVDVLLWVDAWPAEIDDHVSLPQAQLQPFGYTGSVLDATCHPDVVGAHFADPSDVAAADGVAVAFASQADADTFLRHHERLWPAAAPVLTDATACS